MKYSEVQTKLQSIAHEACVIDYELEMNESFNDQGFDSLDRIEFFMTVEKEFNIHLPDEKLSDVNTPHQLVELVIFQTHLSQAPELPTL